MNMRRRRILSSGFVARMEDTRVPKCVVLGEQLVGDAGCVGGATQDEGEWRKTAEQGAARFMADWIITAEKARAGLRHAVVCLNTTGRTKQGEDSPKKACSCLFARHT